MINCFIQARMGSTRFPGKVMHEWRGKPLIGWLLDRMVECQEPDKIVVLIPQRDADTELFHYLRNRDAIILMGPEEDVAERFRMALQEFPCEGFVRLCADSPLIEYQLIDGLIKAWRSHPSAYLKLGTPAGHIELCDTACWLKVLPHFTKREKEHVTLFYNERPGRPVIDCLDDLRALDNWRDIGDRRPCA